MHVREYLLTIWAYIAIGLVTLIAFPFELFLFIVLYPFDKQRYYVGRLFRLTSVASIKLNPLWDFSIVGELPEKTPQRTIFVGNHLSLADVGLISHLPWEMKWMSKASIFLIPFIGWAMWLVGDISIHRGSKDSAKEALEKCKQWLGKGANVMIFPEGTRSRDGRMGAFKDGAFRLAIETGAPIVPLGLAGTAGSIAVGSWRMRQSKGLVSVGTPIPTEGMTLDDVEKLKAQVLAQIVKIVEELTPLTLPDKPKHQ